MRRSQTVQEFAAIAQLRAIFRDQSRHVELGIGDDAAVLSSAGRLVWTIDTAVEHVHFERGWLSLADLGWRSFHAAASDVCAMGGAPIAALSSVIFPAGFRASQLAELARGQRAAARALGCTVAGGNLSRGSELSVTSTLLGAVSRPILRSGAKPGDELWLCGELGWAAAGLRVLQRGRTGAAKAAARRALAAFRRPQAQLAAGLALAGRARAAIDISDGLAGDAAHLAKDSGVQLVLELPALRASLGRALVTLAERLGTAALQLALYGGEDYALLAAGPMRKRPAGVRVIGRVQQGRGVWLSEGATLTPAAAGFQHSGGRKAPGVGR